MHSTLKSRFTRVNCPKRRMCRSPKDLSRIAPPASVYGRSTAAPQLARPLNSTAHPLFLPLPVRLSTVDCQPLLPHPYLFYSHLFNLTAEVCSNDPTVL